MHASDPGSETILSPSCGQRQSRTQTRNGPGDHRVSGAVIFLLSASVQSTAYASFSDSANACSFIISSALVYFALPIPMGLSKRGPVNPSSSYFGLLYS